MPVSDSYRPDPRFAALGPDFADAVEPAAFAAARLIRRDRRAAARVGLDSLTDAEWDSAFRDFNPLPDNQSAPLAMRYHGHQFRVYNPQIGDGRGFLFAQMRDARGRLLDLGTKGSGQTPHSRTGDGRMTLQGGVRETIAAAFLEAVGVAGCAIISLYETGERLARQDEPNPARGGLMTRLQHSHVRIGTFQRHAAFERPDLIRALMEHCVEVYFPDVAAISEAERPAAFLRQVVAANARLAASWMAAGIVHGVINSDNMTVTGESFDYGPTRFLPVFAPDFTSAYFDHGGLYAYGRQAEAALWNLARLAECLALVADMSGLEPALKEFQTDYQGALAAAFVRRLGLAPATPAADVELTRATTRFMAESQVPFEAVFFDWFGGETSRDRALGGGRAALYRGAAFDAFRARLGDHDAAPAVDLSHAYFAAEDPVRVTLDVVRDVWGAIDEGDDWAPFETLLARVDAARDGYGLAPD